MDFGKLNDISQVNFSLPPDISMLRSSPAAIPEILIGATGWSMPEWKGYLYPPRTPAERFGMEYSRQFATIEFNTTYYQIGDLLPDFINRMSMLEEKLGMIFMQLPQFFGSSKLQSLQNFVQQWSSGIPLAIELRHPEYFQEPLASEVAASRFHG